VHKVKYILFFILLSIPSFASDITLSQDETDKLIKQLEADKKTIQMYLNREEKLRKEEPVIYYEFKKGGEVKQKIMIPVENDNPLEYTVNFKVNAYENEGWFPMYLWLGGFAVNTTLKDAKIQDYADCKFGIKLLSLAPLDKDFIRNLGFNVSIGLRSAGFSLSYKLFKPFEHTNIHLFYGYAYSTPLQKTFGIGVSLNF
jgi:hypothetical protein